VSEPPAPDRRQIEQWLARWLPELESFVRLRVGRAFSPRESTSDVVQSTCREILEHAPAFQTGGEEGFKRWLFKMALRKIANRYEHHRAQRRDLRRERALHGSSSGFEAALQGSEGPRVMSPSSLVAGAEDLARFEEVFAELPERYREVIVEARLLGTPHAELAARWGRNEGAVRALLFRALATLADRFESSRRKKA
jgi:RNA polymerase sigma factor (sigma-70 family)